MYYAASAVSSSFLCCYMCLGRLYDPKRAKPSLCVQNITLVNLTCSCGFWGGFT